MAWYRTGTISVTNGSATVTGSGTAFVANVRAGYALVAPDGRTYEVTAVVSNTQLTIAPNYQGSTASGQGYAIYPTQSVIADLATQAAELIASFAAVRDGPGQGLFNDGTVAAPGIRFASDQDTGFTRTGNNMLSVVTGASERARFSPAGLGLGTTSPSSLLHIVGGNIRLPFSNANENALVAVESNTFEHLGVTLPHYGVKWATASDSSNPALFLTGFAGVRMYSGGQERLRVGAAVTPGTDNSQILGDATRRWSVVYAGTGTINTSDEREKTWRGPLSEAEYEAGREVIAELGFYQWNDAIAEKGPDGARYHFGVRAQQVWSIFAAHDLVDPIVDGEPGETPYSFLCFDKWDEQREPILGEGGAPTGEDRVVREAGSRFGVRYNDLTLFLLAVQARRQTEIEARLEALEAAE